MNNTEEISGIQSNNVESVSLKGDGVLAVKWKKNQIVYEFSIDNARSHFNEIKEINKNGGSVGSYIAKNISRKFPFKRVEL